ncbi:Hypothetical predicted protein, partial [Pelobates cultripes]
ITIVIHLILIDINPKDAQQWHNLAGEYPWNTPMPFVFGKGTRSAHADRRSARQQSLKAVAAHAKFLESWFTYSPPDSPAESSNTDTPEMGRTKPKTPRAGVPNKARDIGALLKCTPRSKIKDQADMEASMGQSEDETAPAGSRVLGPNDRQHPNLATKDDITRNSGNSSTPIWH